MRKKIRFLFVCVLIFLSIPGNTQNPDSLDNTYIEDLSDNWLIFQEDYKAWFPLLDKEEKIYTASQLLDLNRYKSYNLNFIAAPGLSLFIENKLVYQNLTGNEEKVRLPLSGFISSTGNEKELLTFYQSQATLPLDQLYIGYTASHLSQESSLVLFNDEFIPRIKNEQENLYMVLFLLILLMVAILKIRYPRKYYEFFGFSKIIPEKDDTLVWDPTGTPFLLFGLINALCGTLILLVIKREFDLESLDFLNIFTSRSLIGVLIVTGVFCLIYIIKYMQLGFFGWVFNVQSLVKYQFLELMKVSLKVNIFLTVLILIFYGSAYGKVEIHFSYFFYFTILSLLIVLLRVGYLTFTLSGFRNIYLFSYLCTTEILPLVIIAKIILL